ncbi:MAG TPA: 2OG-Fe(II) oxygenase [Burkholderiaceae bacterium]|nr:2OG-Fe(II) oxygenase [Burkholderiaceae bacterium]
MESGEGWLNVLAEQGWVVCDDLIDADLCRRLYAHGLDAWLQGFFHPAAVGRGANRAVHTDIRGDAIHWIESDDTSAPVSEFLRWSETLRHRLNEGLYAGLQTAEFHFARYPAGQGYKKHLDQHREQRQRKISLSLYLNEHWTEESAGQLCLYAADDPDTETTRILPRQGRLVLFRSDLIPHEVLPSRQPRYSLTGWFRTGHDVPVPASHEA